MAERLFEKHGPPVRPAWLFELTPLEILAFFTRPAGAREDLDPVAELHRHNHRVRAPKGIAPSVPDWFLPKVPRARDQ